LYFIVLAADKPNSVTLRARTKAAHSRHLDQGGAALRVLQSGPTVSASGAENGSVLILSAPDEATVREFLVRDPYVQAGLFATVEIRQWNWKRGNPFLSEGDR
jgi:uncharacterized protein